MKVQEFIELKQGKSTVLDYVGKFTELSRFAKSMVADEKLRISKFLQGLNGSIREMIVGQRLKTFTAVVDAAYAIEQDRKQSAEKASRFQKAVDGKGNLKKRNFKEFRGESSKQGGNQGSQKKNRTVICYSCGQEGHYRNKCPNGNNGGGNGGQRQILPPPQQQQQRGTVGEVNVQTRPFQQFAHGANRAGQRGRPGNNHQGNNQNNNQQGNINGGRVLQLLGDKQKARGRPCLMV